jgi:signal peptidase I
VKKLLRTFWKNNSAFVFIFLGLVFFRTAIADWNPVPSESMEPTIFAGDVLLINKLVLGPNVPFTEGRLVHVNEPERGDIITLTPPGKDITYVKRVVGVPGDRIRTDGMRLIINDEMLPLRVIDDGERTGLYQALETLGKHQHLIQHDLRYPMRQIEQELTVPADSYFVMGDFRNNSEDSRWFGFVHQDRIIGKVTRVAVSIADERSLLGAPGTELH